MEAPTSDFADIFFNKIANIHKQLTTLSPAFINEAPKSPPPSHHPFTEFTPITDSDILKLISNSPIKSYNLDPLPTQIFKSFIPNLL